MKSHKKKMIAPIIITAIFIIYYVIYFAFLIFWLEGILKYAFGIIPVLLSIVTIYVCIERIEEIKEGEEDDISQY